MLIAAISVGFVIWLIDDTTFSSIIPEGAISQDNAPDTVVDTDPAQNDDGVDIQKTPVIKPESPKDVAIESVQANESTVSDVQSPPNPSSEATNEESIDTTVPNVHSPTSSGTHYDNTDYLEELYNYALELANQDRVKHGLKPVELSNNTSAQTHAEDMFVKNYFSHWNSNGTKPYVTYTQRGGQGYVAENIAAYICHVDRCASYGTPLEAVRERHYAMVYDDADDDWGHRDNILDPYRTHVNFGISFDENRIYFVQHFENNLINLNELESDDGILSIKGELMQGYRLRGISVSEDPSPKQLTGQIIETTPPYTDDYYDWGTSAGIISEVPHGYHYPECSPGVMSLEPGTCIPYSLYSIVQSGHDFELTTDVNKWLQRDGLHTIYIFLETEDGDTVPATSLTLEYL